MYRDRFEQGLDLGSVQPEFLIKDLVGKYHFNCLLIVLLEN